jgi:hypothetical protein
MNGEDESTQDFPPLLLYSPPVPLEMSSSLNCLSLVKDITCICLNRMDIYDLKDNEGNMQEIEAQQVT